MKQHLLSTISLLFLCNSLFAFSDTAKVKIPLDRQIFHDRLDKEQRDVDRLDGKRDNNVRITSNDDINIQIADAFLRKVDNLQDEIELNQSTDRNTKVRYITYLEKLLQQFQIKYRNREIHPASAPGLVDHFAEIMYLDIKGESMAPVIDAMPFDAGDVLTSVFSENPGYKECRKLVFLKEGKQNPKTIIPGLKDFINESFADSLVVVAANIVPLQLYDYAQAWNTEVGKLIRRNKDPKVKLLVKLSGLRSGMLYFPFMDDLLSGRQSIEDIGSLIDDDTKYYKRLVKTQLDYTRRMMLRDTPVVMNALAEMLQKKAVTVFITKINDLHEEPESVRFRILESFSPQELYYLVVLGEEDIYTSSYTNVYKRMMDRFPGRRGDSLLMSVNFDKYKKFIKMAAAYNTLDDFLKSMPELQSTRLMYAFVNGLQKTGTLEDAVDVADSYASILNPDLKSFLKYEVKQQYQKSVINQDRKGEVIYNILQDLFESATDSTLNISDALGIPPVYSVDYTALADDSGRVIQQVFFYGDKDGKESYRNYMSLFTNKNEWKVTTGKEWTTIQSVGGRPVWIYANLPLEGADDPDWAAQRDLCAYLESKNLNPAITIHRGHSYHLKYTIDQMAPSSRIVVLGSCGGYRNLQQVLNISDDAHIISSKQVGTRTVNEPILRALNECVRNGKNVEWISLWKSLAGQLKNNELFSDYIPPHKNLGALFIKAYKIAMGEI